MRFFYGASYQSLRSPASFGSWQLLSITVGIVVSDLSSGYHRVLLRCIGLGAQADHFFATALQSSGLAVFLAWLLIIDQQDSRMIVVLT